MTDYNRSIFQHVVQFGYGQVLVYDKNIHWSCFAFRWTHIHHLQGFARRDNIVSFVALSEYGRALVSAYEGPYVPRHPYDRVIAVPFTCKSRAFIVAGPEDSYGESLGASLSQEHYRLYIAQKQLMDPDLKEGDGLHELVDLCFDPVDRPIEKSEILVADIELDPPETLLETVELDEAQCDNQNEQCY